MNNLRQAAQQALEALEQSETTVPYEGFGMAQREAERKHHAAITALKTALAEPVQEPVAWRTFDGEGNYDYLSYENNEDYIYQYIKRNGGKYASWVEPLYTSPPQRKALTDETLWEMWVESPSDVLRFARAIERAHGIGNE